MAQREHLRTVRKWHRTFTRRIEGCKQINEQSHDTQMRGTFFGDVEGEASSQQRPGHVGKSEEQQRAAAEGVDGPDGWPCEDEVDETEAEGGDEGIPLGGAGLAEYCA